MQGGCLPLIKPGGLYGEAEAGARIKMVVNQRLWGIRSISIRSVSGFDLILINGLHDF
jgi:hypothetical protein